MSLHRLFGRSGIDIDEMLRTLGQAATAVGLPFGERTMTYNSRLAQELGLWAESLRQGEAFHRAAFAAYFVEGRNLAQEEVLLDVAERAQLEPEAAREVLRQRSFKAAVDADWRLSREMGITAVPTFVLAGRRLTGAHPYPELRRFVENAAGLSRPTP